VTLGIMGFIFQGVDNYAHFGGFVGGYLASAFLDPLRKERMDHLVMAAVCMILTALAILASAVQFYPLLIG
jgi:membrane associated rhomboid family serine protease